MSELLKYMNPDAFNAGLSAGWMCVSKFKNPYPAQTTAHDAWNEGHTEGLEEREEQGRFDDQWIDTENGYL